MVNPRWRADVLGPNSFVSHNDKTLCLAYHVISSKVLCFPNKKKVKQHKVEMVSLSETSQGIALHHVLTPCLRDKIKAEMPPFYQHLVRSFGLDKQTYPKVMKNIPPSKVHLTYERINSNHTATHRSLYDYCVKDEVSLAKLFMKPFMAQFSTFDCSFDSSAALQFSVEPYRSCLSTLSSFELIFTASLDTEFIHIL